LKRVPGEGGLADTERERQLQEAFVPSSVIRLSALRETDCSNRETKLLYLERGLKRKTSLGMLTSTGGKKIIGNSPP